MLDQSIMGHGFGAQILVIPRRTQTKAAPPHIIYNTSLVYNDKQIG